MQPLLALALLCSAQVEQNASTRLDPATALDAFVLADGFDIELVASEPNIMAPIDIEVDGRGRIWVLQGAGQTRLTLQDERGGSFRNFAAWPSPASGFALGVGGVWISHANRILFLPDEDHDGVADRAATTVLSGFVSPGPRALVLGPDGWLYGVQASEAESVVHKQPFTTAIWRYQQDTDRFEVFAIGAAPLVLAFDHDGNLLGPARSEGSLLTHFVAGGRYDTAGDHLAPCPHEGEVDPPVRGCAFVAAADWPIRPGWVTLHPARSRVAVSHSARLGSSLQTEHATLLLSTPDASFQPIDVVQGLGGRVYIAEGTAATGRIWCVAPRRTTQLGGEDLTKLEPSKLVQALTSGNAYLARTATRLLSEVSGSDVLPTLEHAIWNDRDPQVRLNSLWGLHASGGLDQPMAERLLRHPDEALRAWTVRLISDDAVLADSMGRQFTFLAAHETRAIVRRQLACASPHLPRRDALALTSALLERGEDANDPFIPQLLWWAIEALMEQYEESIVHRLATPRVWLKPLTARHILPRVMRSLSERGDERGLTLAARILRAAPSPSAAEPLLQILDEAFADELPLEVPEELHRAVAAAPVSTEGEPEKLQLRLWLGSREALDEALLGALSAETPTPERVELITRIGACPWPGTLTPLFELARDDPSVPVRIAALGALRGFTEDSVARRLLRWYPRFTDDASVRAATIELLCSRVKWGQALLVAVSSGRVQAEHLSEGDRTRLREHGDPRIDAALDRLGF